MVRKYLIICLDWSIIATFIFLYHACRLMYVSCRFYIYMYMYTLYIYIVKNAYVYRIYDTMVMYNCVLVRMIHGYIPYMFFL